VLDELAFARGDAQARCWLRANIRIDIADPELARTFFTLQVGAAMCLACW
jgi:hypothetical protein